MKKSYYLPEACPSDDSEKGVRWGCIRCVTDIHRSCMIHFDNRNALQCSETSVMWHLFMHMLRLYGFLANVLNRVSNLINTVTASTSQQHRRKYLLKVTGWACCRPESVHSPHRLRVCGDAGAIKFESLSFVLCFGNGNGNRNRNTFVCESSGS